MANEQKTSPATTSCSYDKMRPLWNQINALLGGTHAMRDAEVKYLPAHAAESVAVYNERLAAAVLFNITKITLEGWVGRPFSEGLKYSDDFDPKLKELLEDADLKGNNLATFARSWFREGIAKAFSHVLVDMPELGPSSFGDVRTLQDDEDEGVRPYLVHIVPENLIFAHSEIRNGREVVLHFRVREVITERDGWGERKITQIRSYTLKEFEFDDDGEQIPPFIQVELYRPVDPKQNGPEDEWKLWSTHFMEIDHIPLITFYASQSGFMFGDPELIDLSDLNIRHWQSNSDQISILTIARFPILALSGGSQEGTELEVGPRKWLFCKDAKSKFYYVEHKGEAIESGHKELIDLEEQMKSYGAEFLRKRKGTTSATERTLDSKEATSPLQDITIRFNDVLNEALNTFVQWMGEDKLKGSVTLNTDFGEDLNDSADVQELGKGRERRDLSREAWISEMQEKGIISADFDTKKNDEQLASEDMDLLNVAKLTIDPKDDEVVDEDE